PAHRIRSLVGFYVCGTDDQAARIAIRRRRGPCLGLRDRRRSANAGRTSGVDVYADYFCADCLASPKFAECDWRRGDRPTRNATKRSLRSIVSVNIRFCAVDRFDRSALAGQNAKCRCLAANDRVAISAGMPALVSELVGSAVLE